MNIDFKNIQVVASRMPEIISKGQKVIGSVQTLYSSLKSKDTPCRIDSLVESQASSDNVSETAKPQNDNTGVECNTSKSLDLSIEGVGTLSAPIEVVTTINEMARQANETIRFCEEQKTTRTDIRANATKEITKINVMANMVRDYLKQSFDERAELFDNYFLVLDRALERGDNTLVAQTLQSINSLAASSPFKDLSDFGKVSTMLAEGGEWDI